MGKNISKAASLCDKEAPKAIENPYNPLIYIFVNPTSGGNAAAAMLRVGANELVFTEEGVRSNVYINNIRDGDQGNKPGFLNMKRHIEEHDADVRPVHVIIAGGDGTVMWAISEAEAHGIDMSRISFGVIPYGTGNDFARSLGWGGSSPGKGIMRKEMSGFKALIREYLRADIIDFDIWRISVKVLDDKGLIKQVRDGTKVVMKEGEFDKKVLSKPMCNYFSVGVESRIGLGFDKNRTTSSFRNKLRYGIEGVKKMFLSTPRIAELVDSCVVCDNNERVLFSTNPQEAKKFPFLNGNPVSLIFLNICSFAGGCDLWSGSKKSGLVSQEEQKPESFAPQFSGDGKLDILTYTGLLGLSLEQSKSRILGGNGRRVGQEAGPLILNFKKNVTDKRTYMQIDGEFFTLENVESISVSHNLVVKVLRKNNNIA